MTGTELASRTQLRMGLMRWILVCVPAVVLLGLLSGRLSGSGYANPWFAALLKPGWMPPAWAFPVAWTLLYILMGVALAMILSARGARGRGRAIGLFCVQLAVNLAWSPVFFALHRVDWAMAIIGGLIVLVTACVVTFGRIRRVAGLLLLPYLGWLMFASVLNFSILTLNPHATELAPSGSTAHIRIGTAR